MANFWFAFYTERYEAKTAHLTMLQDGAYGRLLRYYYKTGKPIPESNEQIIRISGAHSEEEIAAVSFVLQSFFRLKSDGWHNRTANEELLRVKKISKLRQQSAKRRWDDKAPAKPMQEDMQKHVPLECDLDLHIHKPKTRERKSAIPLPEDFIPLPADYELGKQFGVMVDLEFQKFRDWALGNGVKKQDWRATFRNWIRRTHEFGGKGGQRIERPVGANERPASAAVARFQNNRTELARAFGASAVGGSTHANSTGQASRLGSGEPIVLEAEVKKLQ